MTEHCATGEGGAQRELETAVEDLPLDATTRTTWAALQAAFTRAGIRVPCKDDD